MTSTGGWETLTGTPLWTFAASCWSAGGWRGVRRAAAAGDVMAASWCGPVPGVTCARPPAVAVIGLRRSGRTGNGESPPRAHRARLPARAAQFTPDSGPRQRARDHSRRKAHGALRAPLKTYRKFSRVGGRQGRTSIVRSQGVGRVGRGRQGRQGVGMGLGKTDAG
jgi:hypothetical protein